MSRWMTAAQGTRRLTASDTTVVDDRMGWRWSNHIHRKFQNPWSEGKFWTTSRWLGGAGGLSLADDAGSYGVFQAWDVDDTGGQQAKIIEGTTKDAGGANLGSCIVQGFLTADDTFVGETTSDTAGYFRLPTRFTGAHYLVCYKAGAPDVAGTSVNTIVPV